MGYRLHMPVVARNSECAIINVSNIADSYRPTGDKDSIDLQPYKMELKQMEASTHIHA